MYAHELETMVLDLEARVSALEAAAGSGSTTSKEPTVETSTETTDTSSSYEGGLTS